MGSDGHRWQAAMGAITGALVVDAIVHGSGTTWGEIGQRSIRHAEDLLAGKPVAIDLAPAESAPVAVGLSRGASPLLADSATVELIEHVRDRLTTPVVGPSECLAEDRFVHPLLAGAAHAARDTPDLPTVIDRANGDPSIAIVAGTLFGLHGGVGALPARLVSTVRGPDGRRGRRYLSRLVDRLLDLQRIDWYDPRHRRGPREVLPGVWLSNIHGLDAFTAEQPEGLVLSLCDIEGRLDEHPHQITFHLDDTPKPDANPRLAHVLDDVLTEIAGARERGQPVLVHCRHGASRTGLVLRLLLVDDLGLDADQALTEAQCLWPHTSTWNAAWGREVERRAQSRRP